ncbi:CpaB family protein [Actinomadura spongiicola]|uniref:hypothetical protein n=1 Tax=Actinomadura spongiicola TaxID=2303421 RepID=UPI00131499B5|nr:hypothetical protein [Actinomadura spongiicola]
MGGLVEGAAGLLSKRLVVTTWIPLFVLLSALAALVAAGAGWDAVTRTWDAVPADLRILAGLALLAATTLLAHLLNAVRPQLFRLYEGYWPKRLENRYRKRHVHRHAKLLHRETDPWPTSYPRNQDKVRPTRLGNILYAAEEHPWFKYRLPANEIWPRLYAALPESFVRTFSGVAAAVELMVTLSLLAVVFACVGAVLAVALLPWYVAPLVMLCGALVSGFCYVAAVRAAVPYANQIRVAFDVHRWKLLQAIGLRLPTSYNEELDQWRQLRKLWFGAGPDSEHEGALRYPEEAGPIVLSLPPAAAPPAPTPAPAPAPGGPVPSPAPPAPPAAVRSPSLTRDLALVLAAALLCVTAIGLVRASTASEPTETRRALPAYHQLKAEDLTGPDAALVNRYTLGSVKAGEPLAKADLGPRLPPNALAQRSISVVTLAPGSAELVRPGDRATLRWTPNKDRDEPVRTVGDALVLRVGPKDRAVVAVPAARLADLPTRTPVQIAR